MTPGQRKYRASREAEFRRRDEVARRRDEDMERAADEAVELLLDRLGNRLQEFIDIWTRTEPFYIGMLLMKKREAMAQHRRKLEKGSEDCTSRDNSEKKQDDGRLFEI